MEEDYLYYIKRHGHTGVHKDDIYELNQVLENERIEYFYSFAEKDMYFYERVDKKMIFEISIVSLVSFAVYHMFKKPNDKQKIKQTFKNIRYGFKDAFPRFIYTHEK